MREFLNAQIYALLPTRLELWGNHKSIGRNESEFRDLSRVPDGAYIPHRSD